MQYFDKNGTEITAGMYLRMEDGSVEQVFATEHNGEPSLGINASNEAYLKNHPDKEREYYSLSNFNMREVEICDPELERHASVDSVLADARNRSAKTEQAENNQYYKTSDGFFDYFVNAKTGDKKFTLDEGDVCVERKADDFYREPVKE